MSEEIPAARLRSWVVRQADAWRTDPERRGAALIFAVVAVGIAVFPFLPFPNP